MSCERNSPEAAALRREEALELRIKGWSIRAIAEFQGVSKSAVAKYIKQELDELAADTRESAEEVREIELRRIDAAVDVCMKFLTDEYVNQDDPEKSKELRLKAIDRLAKLNDQRSKLLGLYAPQEVKQTITDSVSPQKIRDAVKARFGGNVAPQVDDASDSSSDNSDS